MSTQPTPDPHAVELDRLLDELSFAAQQAEGLLQAADVIYAGLEEDGTCRTMLKGTTDGMALRFLIDHGSMAAFKASELVSRVEEHLGAGGYRPGGGLHSGPQQTPEPARKARGRLRAAAGAPS